MFDWPSLLPFNILHCFSHWSPCKTMEHGIISTRAVLATPLGKLGVIGGAFLCCHCCIQLTAETSDHVDAVEIDNRSKVAFWRSRVSDLDFSGHFAFKWVWLRYLFGICGASYAVLRLQTNANFTSTQTNFIRNHAARGGALVLEVG